MPDFCSVLQELFDADAALLVVLQLVLKRKDVADHKQKFHSQEIGEGRPLGKNKMLMEGENIEEPKTPIIEI